MTPFALYLGFLRPFAAEPITDYRTALLHYNARPDFKRRSLVHLAADGIKPIARQIDATKTMRQLDDGSVAFRYYETDAVIWHPDGAVTIGFYPSQSTTAFINAFVPWSTIDPLFTRWPYTGVFTTDPWNNARLYVMGRDAKVRLRKDGTELDYRGDTTDRWEPDGTYKLGTFPVPRIDREQSKAAREAHPNYLAFKHWAGAKIGLSVPGTYTTPTNRWGYVYAYQPRQYSIPEVVGLLDLGVEHWDAILDKMGTYAPGAMLGAIYQHEGVDYVTEEREVVTRSQYDAARAFARR